MGIQYGITKPFIDEEDFLEIAEQQFKDLKATKSKLLQILGIEEAFNIMLENYEELEQELLSRTLRQIMYSSMTWSSFTNDRSTISRRIINLLTSCRAYLDQIGHIIKGIYGENSEQFKQYEQSKKDEFEARLSYKVLEALRNYTQHYGPPIHGLSYKGEWLEDRSFAKRTIRLTLNVDDLQVDKKFKQQTLDELKSLGSQVDLKPQIREYVASLGRIHASLRSRLNTDTESWEETLNQARKQYQEAFRRDGDNLAIVSRNEQGKFVERISILEEAMERLHWLREKNRNSSHYDRHYVSGEIS